MNDFDGCAPPLSNTAVDERIETEIGAAAGADA
jgi:hypothetical protein